MAAILVAGDTVRIPELRHEVPISIPDAFLFAEVEGRGHVVVSALEVDRVQEIGGLDVHPFEDFGYDALLGRGMPIRDVRTEVYVRACRELGVARASVPESFPLGVADRLRGEGVQLEVEQELFDRRRRSKNEVELAGIRRAQHAAESAMRACVETLAAAERRKRFLEVEGEPLTVELVKRRMEEALLRHDVSSDEFIVACGAQAAVGHEAGSGPIAHGESVVVDLWPRDRASACFADMTRTFVVGEVPDELREYHRLTKEALDLAIAMVRPGVDGRDVYGAVCDHFEANGYATGRSKEPGTVLQNGFFHGLGHGVGLDIHERPGLSRYGDALVAGDVITLEPGLYRKGFGGVRLEDLLLVTEDGAENLTDFPYELEVA